MRRVNLYDEESLAHLLKLQQDHEWDLEDSINWSTSLDLNLPLVPLDSDALFFPGASSEQRLAISQMMGLIIAASICEMEECLIRLRKESWDDIVKRYPVSPEFNELGNQFFVEEVKHSAAFRRYIELFAHQTGIDTETLLELLPKVEKTRTEAILRANVKKGGQTFWWIVATVEQQFLLMYHIMRPHQEILEPLYFDLHKKHFEEEARHAPFPYLMLELLVDRNKKIRNHIHTRVDLIFAQFLQTMWTFDSLQKTKNVKKVKGMHPFFDALAEIYPLLKKQPLHRLIWQVVTTTPYVSTLVNLNAHKRIQRLAEDLGSGVAPFPAPTVKKLVNY